MRGVRCAAEPEYRKCTAAGQRRSRSRSRSMKRRRGAPGVCEAAWASRKGTGGEAAGVLEPRDNLVPELGLEGVDHPGLGQ